MEKNYKTAQDFWQELRIQFGDNAKSVAFAYLDTVTAQKIATGREDPEELLFCCDLFNLISA